MSELVFSQLPFSIIAKPIEIDFKYSLMCTNIHSTGQQHICQYDI